MRERRSDDPPSDSRELQRWPGSIDSGFEGDIAQRCTLVLTGALIVVILLAGGAVLLAHAENAKMKIPKVSFSSAQTADASGVKAVRTARHDISRTVAVAGEPRGFKSPILDTAGRFSHLFSTHEACTT